ncbi:ubiquitin-protein transferase activating protein PEX22 Ecym_5011 [Eremothecium cymbalariae DBVPG|uniref:Peroxisome assembly protein 22 n=1 Tax=Eremothecium cymbalariae (strain CBS 270.75 / DBVPG 7215 / KCTC 17166 / NRRL Y-17582) TaxID=931890 RepID=I6NCM2_ERECY|nr:hypothetical protein Ecym_5011 [Eremothecium cymbalariae DBVPG\
MVAERRTSRILKPLVAVAGFALAAGVIVYSYWNSSDTPEKKRNYKEYRRKCIIWSPAVEQSSNLETILLEDSVILIPPESGSLQDLLAVGNENAYKIIKCDTWQGVWSCVRHLRAHYLLLKECEIPEAIPVDILNYVNKIISI